MNHGNKEWMKVCVPADLIKPFLYAGIYTTVGFSLGRTQYISDIMTALINNGILPTTRKDIYFQSGMADSGEKFILDLFVPTHSGANAVLYGGPSTGSHVHRNR